MKKSGGFKDISLMLILVTLSLLFNIFAAFKDFDKSFLLAVDLVSIILVIYCCISFFIKNRARTEYIELLSDNKVTAANEVLNGFPLAMAVFDIDGAVLWFNDEFQKITKNNNLYFTPVNTIFPELKWMDILKSNECIKMEMSYNDRVYNIFGRIAKSNENGKKEKIYSVILYFEDITELVIAKKMYADEKTDVAIVNIDNYDEIFQRMDDAQSQEIISKINSLILRWGAESEAVTKKLERDKYLILFEHAYLEKYTKEKFDIIEKVRKIGEEVKSPVTISIGVGTGGHIHENENNARAAMEMVWGRGGDQAAIKNQDQYTFYGGKTKDYEKSTRVKTRAFSVALRDYIAHSEDVIFMGHANADYDSFGSALGLQRAARTMGKKPYIVFDQSRAVETITDEVRNNIEYENMLITPEEAMEIASENTLLIILDTHRKSMLPCPELLEVVNKVIIIDHHRRSTDFISPVSLTYHEPYASSTCEMVTEILQHIGDVRKITVLEAQALYMGILMDTKNFVVKTGIRTFEAASYLKRCGLNTVDIKKLFNIDRDEYIHRIDIVKNSEIYMDCIAITTCRESYENMRVISSQAADDMMNISGVKAAFVIYPMDSSVCISARSYGDINVQLIMEKLGGGGHAIVAGAQIKNSGIEMAEESLKGAIEEYLKELN